MGGKKSKSQTPTQKTLSEASHVLDHTIQEKVVHFGLRNASKIAGNVAKTVVKAAPKVLPAIVKSAPAVLKALPVVAKSVAPFLGGVPGAIMALASGKGNGADQLEAEPWIDRAQTKAQYMADKERSSLLDARAANPGRTQMYQSSLGKQSYSGQSAMGKAVIRSAKKKV